MFAPHAWCNDTRRLYFLECACPPSNYLCSWRIGDQREPCRKLCISAENGSFGVIHRGGPLRRRLYVRHEHERQNGRAGGRRKGSFRGEPAGGGVGATKERAKRGRIEPYIIAIGKERRETISPLRPPRPFSISLLRYSSTAAFNDRAGHPRRPFPLFLTRPRRVRRAWQKATNGADSERKECSRRLNWLGDGWFMARFTMADPQSATPPARERREKVRDPPSPVASSHANWNG